MPDEHVDVVGQRVVGAGPQLRAGGGLIGVAVLAVILQGAVTSVGQVQALQESFWWSVGFTGLAVVLSFLLPGRPRSAREAPAEQQLESTAA